MPRGAAQGRTQRTADETVWFRCECGWNIFKTEVFLSGYADAWVRAGPQTERNNSGLVVYDSDPSTLELEDDISGPFTCGKCGKVYNELPPPGWQNERPLTYSERLRAGEKPLLPPELMP